MTLHLSTSTERKLRRELTDRPDLLALLPTVKVKRSVKLARERKRDKDALAAEQHHRLVERVRARDADLCQLCPPGTILVERAAKPGDPVDVHHLEHGSGKAKNERLSNMLCAHRTCHDAYHANVRAFVARVKRWCGAYGYALPNRKEYRK